MRRGARAGRRFGGGIKGAQAQTPAGEQADRRQAAEQDRELWTGGPAIDLEGRVPVDRQNGLGRTVQPDVQGEPRLNHEDRDGQEVQQRQTARHRRGAFAAWGRGRAAWPVPAMSIRKAMASSTAEISRR
ncbi:hypothetical protein [Brevundimonas sp.]|uniref:hypothetical protein n=1 Tax=Brevundimonas sp. TaxID=1871086 RepID=UPI003BAA761D